MCGAMTWVSDPKLVSTVSNEGGFGCLAGGNTPVDILEKQIDDTLALTDKPFGLNIITISPSYREHLELAKSKKLPFIIFAGSFPRKEDVEIAKETGAKVLCFASTKSIAQRMLNYGADGLILEGMEAGGHVGHVSLTILIQQVLFEFPKIPIFAAGGIATGKMCAHLLMMGFSGVQMGTVFAVSEESCAHEKFKRQFIRANARDAVSTPQFDSRLPVVAVRALRNKGLDEFKKLQMDLINQMDDGKINRIEAQEKVELFWMGSLRRAVVEGDIDRGSLMSGQSVGLVKEVKPIRTIISDLLTDIESELKSVHDRLV